MSPAKKPLAVAVVPAAVSSARLYGLDGLRAIAVLTVIAYHFVPSGVVGGYIGVDVFFVLSGFLITGLLVRERTLAGTVSLPAFWARRVRRLIPALVLVVTTCSAAAFFIGGDVLVRLGSQVLGAATFSSNWLYIAQGTSYFDDTTPQLFRNLWSLAVEEQFYLLWPGLLLLVLLLPWRALRIGVVGALGVASALAMALLFTPPGDATRVYFGTDTHSFGLALGAALALALEGRFLGLGAPRRILPWLGAIAVGGLVALALSMPDTDPFVTRGGLALVAVLTAVAIAGATSSNSWLGASLDLQPLRWIGERSYGLYLWHWPVLILLVAVLPADAAWWLTPVAALVITAAAAALSFHFVERPIMTLGFKGAVATLRRPIQRAVAASAALALVTAATLTGAAIASDPGKGEAQLAIERGEQLLTDDPLARDIGFGPRHPAPLPGGEQIYAIGDSVMLAASPWLLAEYPGIIIDASVSRSMWVGPGLVQNLVDSGRLRPVLIVGLATNGDVELDDLEAIVASVGPETLVVVVNAQAPKDWIPIGNATLSTFARHERTVELANWHDAIAGNIADLADDEVHPGGPITGGIYVDSITQALQRLAELPPLRGEGDYRWLPRPL